MKMAETDVIWTPTWSDEPAAGQISTALHCSGWKRTRGDFWMPATSFNYQSAPKDDPIKQLLAMFILFNTIVVRDGLNPKKVHEAFLTIDEYRKTISPDAPGAEE